ncbi:LeuD/DmdB family oxidoreductase small subunit [Cupriavidus basilensis]
MAPAGADEGRAASPRRALPPQACARSFRAARPGDVVVAGANFGIGSSREQAPQALRHLGVRAVVAPSFGGLFYRNAINLGLPVLVCPDTSRLADGAVAALDLENAVLQLGDGTTVACEPVPAFLREILGAGGLDPRPGAARPARN